MTAARSGTGGDRLTDRKPGDEGPDEPDDFDEQSFLDAIRRLEEEQGDAKIWPWHRVVRGES